MASGLFWPVADYSKNPALRRAVRRALEQVGRRVRKARLAAKLTQEKTAERAGLAWRRYQDIEGGRLNVTVATLVRISRALKCGPRAII